MIARSTLLLLSLMTTTTALGCGGGGGKTHAPATSPGTTGSTTGTSTGSTGTTTSSSTGTSTTSSGGTTTTPSGGTSSAIGQVFPATNPWNQDISALPVHPNSANYMASIGLTTGVHPDFGTVYNGAPNGIPFITVGQGQPLVPINVVAYASESDPGPYPAPTTAPIEGGPGGTGDRHVIVVDTSARKLFELYRAFPNGTGGWDCDSAAIFDLTSNNLRPAGWTSADAAGLPIFPGLVRYDEAVTAGAINHALRFTVARSQRGYISPARHFASSSTDVNLAPMGLRVRLKASVSTAGYPPEVVVILTCLKKYGMLMADNGSNWYISGAPDPRWNDSNLATLSRIKGSDFEAVDTGPIITR